MVSESIVRTPARTRLLNGQEMNSRLGSIRITSMAGSSRRTYLAAVAPPQPPPITTTRGPFFGAKSPLIAVAHPARLVPASTPSPSPEDRRNARRVTALIIVPPPPWCRIEFSIPDRDRRESTEATRICQARPASPPDFPGEQAEKSGAART